MASSDDGLLEVTLRGTSFSQTGSWSMVDIGKLVVGLPITLLQRFAGSSVQPYTVLTAQAMGSTFRLTWGGRKRISDALTKLPAAQVITQNLKIGFGIDDVARVIARGEGGMTILALCAALQECYADDIAVEILLEYARTTKASDSWMPSHLDWKAFLDICAGSLSCSNFSRHAETLMSLCGDCCLRSLYCDASIPKAIRGCSAPQSIAVALFHLAELTNGKLTAVTLCGGPDIGWIAAVADWILSLRVAIFIEQTDELRWQNFNDHDECQVRILVRPTQAKDDVHGLSNEAAVDTIQHDVPRTPLAKMETTARSLTSIDVRDTTRRIDFEDTKIIFQGSVKTQYENVVCGRVPWEHALASTFLSDFGHLMEKERTLGTLLGSSARILQAIVDADETIDRYIVGEWTSYCDASYGAGFLDTIAKYFPELSALRQSMVEGLRVSFLDAVAAYDASLSTLELHCKCANCPGPSRPYSFCALIMAESIIYMSHALSSVHLYDDSLMPTRRGIELAYDRLVAVHGTRAPLSGHMKEFGRAAHWVQRVMLLSEGDVQIKSVTERRLSAVLELFTGRADYEHSDTARSPTDTSSAVWTNGLTAYLGILRDQEFQNPNVMSKIYLSPGRIWFNDKTYIRLYDGPLHRPRRLPSEEDLTSQLQNILDCFIAAGDTFRRNGLQVKESALGLRCLLDMETKSSYQRPLLTRVGPCALAWILATRFINVVCERRSQERCEGTLISRQWTRRHEDARHICFVKGKRTTHFWKPYSRDHVAAIVSTLATLPREILSSIFIVDYECQDCCLVHASRDDYEHRKHVLHFIRATPG